MEIYSYCKMHNTYPQADEPCWACIRQFTDKTLNPSDSIAAENQENTKPCRVDGVTLCVQHSGDDCGCDHCEGCPVAIAFKESN